MKKLTKKQIDEVCKAILETKTHFTDVDPGENVMDCVFYNIGYYGKKIDRLLDLIQHGYDEFYTFDRVKKIYDI